jgi:uracil phosphoribosyltransferase
MSYHVVVHPLVAHKLSLLRSRDTGVKDFRNLISELASILAYEASRQFKLDTIEVQTPLQKTQGMTLSGKKVGIVAILRAGLAMVDGVLRQFPNARVGHFGMYRDEKTLTPVEYYVRYLDNLDLRNLLVVDPMLATGGTAIAVIDLLKKKGAKNIKLLNIVASKQGVDSLLENHSDIEGYACTIDPVLNDNGYILPGLGDAGDRAFGTV